MSIAKQIVDGDKKGITWLVVLDSEDNRWTYHKAGPAADGATVHVHQHDDANLEILCGDDGMSLLRQEGPGLPQKMVVQLATPLTLGPGLPVLGGFGGGVFEYEQR
jgi:hypothetical protein